MKQTLLFVMVLVMSTIGTAQTRTKIQLRSTTDKAACVQTDYNSLQAKFSFSTIESDAIENERGQFSWLSMPNTVMGGNIGDPQVPVVSELIAVPQGASPSIRVTHYSSTDYKLADYGIHRLYPRQPSLSKNQKPENVPFVMNEQAYQKRGLRSQPNTTIEVVGTMRGVRLGKMSIEPVSYDPVNSTIRVFNDIEVEVSFEGADAKATEDMLIKTYSPYFDIVYRQLFNGNLIKDAYDDHPDLYSTPVKMLVVTTEEYEQCEAFQTWLAWKKLKGIYVDVQLVTSDTYPADVRNLIKAKYESDPFTFLVIVGDENIVSNYTIYYHSGATYNPYVSDNGYASLDDDCYHDVYLSRMPVSSTTELGNLVNKILTYEQYSMADPSYLDETLIVAGWDSYWNPMIAKPTAQYANQYYLNSDHGITAHVYLDTEDASSDCYENLNHVGFVHYGGHGDIQKWAAPYFDNGDIDDLSNTDKYFWVMGNCCLTANWGNEDMHPCFGEAMVRAANKGAFGYIGSVPESLWYEDYYFDVGAFPFEYDGAVQSPSSTSTGFFDALFDETGFNCLNALEYIGNVAVTLAHYTGCLSDVDDEYYWRAYQCLGDGSVMPYLKQPAANTVSHADILYYGMDNFTVSADPGSYVSITCDGEILGVAEVPDSGTVDVPIDGSNFTLDGVGTIVVTRAQRKPYIQNITIATGDLYIINASANPTNGGTVSGAGTYYQYSDCTLTATPNAPQYEFAFWVVNNAVISVDPVYTFEPNAYYDDAEFIAYFHALTAHSLTCNAASNGSITVDKDMAYKGETVTLSYTCDEYYFLTAWDVRDAGNNPITVTDNQFTMPDSDVTVNATFTKGNMIALASEINGEISTDQTCALPGTTINLTVTFYEGYRLDEWVVYKTDEVNTSVTVTDNQFIMPDYDVTVSAIFSSITATELTLGSGTGTYEGDCVPTNIGSAYSLSQQVYTKGELGAAGKILSISFYYNSTNETLRYLDIYMSHTSESTITSWSNCSLDDLVYQDTHNFEQGWNTLTLQTPFEYDGVNNILITVDDNTGSDLFDDHNFYTYYSDSQSICYYDFSDLSPFASTSYHATHLLHKAQMKVEKESSNHDSYISTSTFSLTGFNAVYGSVPSEPQRLTLVGANLTDIVTIETPQGYEMSTSITGPYFSYLELTPTDGNLRQALYIRLRSEYYPDCYEGNLYLNYGLGNNSVFLSGTVTEGAGTLYTIDVEANPEEGSVIGAGTYYENSECVLTAIPNKHFVFSGWQRDGDIVSVEPRASFTVTGDASYTAVFSDEPKYEVIIAEPEGYHITADSAKAYAYDVITLTGDKELGYFFQSWSVVDANGKNIEVTDSQFVMPKCAVTVSAEVAKGYVIDIIDVVNGHVTASKADGLPGELIQLEATPNDNCFFSEWYVYKTGEPSTVVNIESNLFLLPAYDVTVMAVFKSTSVEDVAIGEGTDANSLIPIKAYFPYSLSQQIYTPEEVGTKGSITAVAFKVTNGKAVSRNIDIFMRNTTLNSFNYDTGWEIMGDNFKVFSGTVNFSASDWTTISFSTPFEYDGVSNIDLCVVDNTGATTEDYPTFLVTVDTYGPFMAMQAYSLSDPFNISNPNTITEYLGGRISSKNQVIFTMTVDDSAKAISINPDTLDTFSYREKNGPSEPQKLDLVGIELSDDITLTVAEDFEVSATEDGTYASSLSIARQTTEVFTPAVVYVRLKEGLSAGQYSGQLTASDGTINVSLSLSGAVTKNYFIEIAPYSNDNDRYYLIASPIGEIAPENVENMLSNEFDLYAFDQTQNGAEWRNYESKSFNIKPGKGYLYANNKYVYLRFIGTPYTGDSQVTLVKDDNASLSGWNLIGNPFAQTAYIEDGRDFYVMKEDGTEIIPAERDDIAVLEGVFVIAATDQETLNFTTTAPQSKDAALVMDVTQHRAVVDRAIVRFGEGRALPKFMLNKDNTKLYISQASEDYAVAIANDKMGEIPVNFKAAKNGSYTIGFNAKNAEFGYLHLIDKLTGADVDLLANPSYSFNANTSDYASRFKLVFVIADATGDSDFAFISNGNLIVHGEGRLQIVDMTGRIVSTEQVNGLSNVRLNAAKGVYLLQLSNSNETKTQKIVVE